MMVDRYPNLKEEVGGLIPDCVIPFLLDRKLVRWSIVLCALVLTCRLSVSQKKKNKKQKRKEEEEVDQ
jgi:hypothetical protein